MSFFACFKYTEWFSKSKTFEIKLLIDVLKGTVVGLKFLLDKCYGNGFLFFFFTLKYGVAIVPIKSEKF